MAQMRQGTSKDGPSDRPASNTPFDLIRRLELLCSWVLPENQNMTYVFSLTPEASLPLARGVARIISRSRSLSPRRMTNDMFRREER